MQIDQIDGSFAEKIISVFKFVYDQKEVASEHTKAAGEALKSLADELEVDKTVVKDAYTKWADAEGDVRLGQVVTLYEGIKRKNVNER